MLTEKQTKQPTLLINLYILILFLAREKIRCMLTCECAYVCNIRCICVLCAYPMVSGCQYASAVRLRMRSEIHQTYSLSKAIIIVSETSPQGEITGPERKFASQKMWCNSFIPSLPFDEVLSFHARLCGKRLCYHGEECLLNFCARVQVGYLLYLQLWH